MVSVQSGEEQRACIYQGMDPQPGPQEQKVPFPGEDILCFP